MADLFFSEYIEGTSNNKALEIYNGTGEAVDLATAGYVVQMYFNGSTSPGLTIPLTGTVANGGVFVLAQSNANPTLLAQANQTNGAGWFNGDDAVILRKGSTVIDAIGQIGFDPGTEWGTGLTSTADNTLRRKSAITSGDTNPSDIFDPSSEWEGFPTDTFDGLGTHSISGSPTAGITIIESGGNTAVNEAGETTDSYSIALNTVPSAAVEIAIASDAQTQISTDGINFFTSVTLSLTDTTPQSITVKAVDDGDVEEVTHTGNITHTITNSADPAYANALIPNLNVEITDNDTVLMLTPIYEIQGSGSVSPLVNTTVSVRGVVTGDFQGSSQLNGFFIQDESGDGDELTSDGIFVFAPNSTDVSVGDVVELSGNVTEAFGQTQIANINTLNLVGAGSVTPTLVNLPLNTPDELERYEGMFVSFPQTLTVTEHFNLGRFGEVSLSAEGRLFNPTNFIDPNDIPSSGTSNDDNNLEAVLAAQQENNLRRILLDDGSNVQNPSTVPYLREDNTLRTGDTVNNLTGVLGYGFNSYRLQPTETPEFLPTNPRTAAPDPVGGNVKVASFNVLNYFTTFNERGANNQTEFERQQTKIFAAIAAIDADVLGLIEIENNGDDADSAIANLVNGLNEYIGETVYDYIRDPQTGVGTDAIKVGFIYKPGTVTPVGDATSSPDPIFERFPVAQTFSLNSNGEVFSTVVNHFKSKSGTGSGADADQGDGQGAFNAKRTQQAEALLSFVNDLQAVTGDSDVLVMGDLNAYGEEDPIDILRNGGLVDELQRSIDKPYSYVFDGQAGYLDHALTTPSLSSQVSGVTEWHINADEPRVLDYNLEFNPADLYTPTPYRSSDHDPVIIGLELVSPANVINGTPQSDRLMGTLENDRINGFAGDDDITGLGGNDKIDGGEGFRDRLFGGAGDDTLTDPDGVIGAHGGTGNDTIIVTFAPDWNMSNSSRNAPRSDGKITGGSGDDQITVTMNDPRFFINLKGDEPANFNSNRPEDGNDEITLSGVYGFSAVDLGGGNDRFNGGIGSDNVSGGYGDDTLLGGEGNDKLEGNEGDDWLFGGLGNDLLTGGGGRDRFILNSGTGTDTITDFTLGEDAIGLANGLSFDALTLAQAGSATQIRATSNNELLGVLNGVLATNLSATDFTVL